MTTHLERFQATMRGEETDRHPRIEWAPVWRETYERWRAEGLPESVERLEVAEHFGLDPYKHEWIFSRGDSGTARKPGIPLVSNMGDYEKLRPLLFKLEDSLIGRLEALERDQRDGRLLFWIVFEGFFWFPRFLMETQNVVIALCEQPELIHRVNEDSVSFILRSIERLKNVCSPAFVVVAEDMCYNNGPMISREMFDEFLAPYYHQIVPAIRDAWKDILILMDTDGDMRGMIPWMLDAGLDGSMPLEKQAHVDAAEIRRRYPDFKMVGNFDKMVMSDGEAAMRAEFERLLPVMKSGGYVLGVDHQTPPQVSLDDYRLYLRLQEEYTDWGRR